MTDSIMTAVRLTPEGAMKWGQFIDVPISSNQTGIYGTSTVVVMFAARGYRMDTTVRLLPGVTDPSALEFDVSDLQITYKAAAVVSALAAVRYDGAHEMMACRFLLSGIIDGQGWGHHTVDGELGAPNVLATAHALSALSGIEDIDAELLEGPADWLSAQVLNDRSLSALELAFAVIALAELRRAGIGPERPDVMRRGAKALRAWLRYVGTEQTVYQQIHFWVPKPGEQRNHHLTFPVQVVVGTALALCSPGTGSRSLLNGLAACLCRAVEADGAVRSTLTERVGVVEAGLVDQFFREYLPLQSHSAGLRRAFLRLMWWPHREPVPLTGLPKSMVGSRRDRA